ncbi:MAG: YbjQ family protein [Planctomycetota bacterium]|nr:YbjQ family protein [Planctomycetota bacterium]
MLLSNLEFVPGCQVEKHLGLVQGSSVRAKHLGRDLMASLKNMVGGELKGYTELLQESRDEAMKRMIQEARGVGANAVINIRLGTASITAGAAEVLAYGTAVVLVEDREAANVGVSQFTVSE